MFVGTAPFALINWLDRNCHGPVDADNFPALAGGAAVAGHAGLMYAVPEGAVGFGGRV